MTKKQAYQIQKDLYENAVQVYLDKSDFNISDWLSPADWQKYRKAYILTDGYDLETGEEIKEAKEEVQDHIIERLKD